MSENLIIRISNGESEFKDESVSDILYIDNSNLNNIQKILSFKNCTFNEYIEIKNINSEKLLINFNDCKFNNKIEISDCKVGTLEFCNTKSITSLSVSSCTLNNLYFRNSNKKLITGDIDIKDNIVLGSLKLDNLNHHDENFTFSLSLKNEYSNIEHQNLKSTFKNSTFKNLELSGGFYGAEADFEKLEIKNELKITDCQFKKALFKEVVSLGKDSIFHDCKFYSYFGFEKNKSNQTNIKFIACLFTSFPHFNGSYFNHLEIKYCTFERKTSFDELEVNSIKLYQAKFIQGAFFDDIKIHDLEKKDYLKNLTVTQAKELRRTLRTIKHELYKTENRIDYYRFRGYELSAYYQELNWDWNEGFKNKLILEATKFVTGFDYSWRRALMFTLLSALIFYSIFFVFQDLNQGKTLDISKYITGYFRFLLVTDFYNPLSKNREFIENNAWYDVLGWIFFILGKIVIAFGIYEMIQAFRKFKA